MVQRSKKLARELIRNFKGEDYSFGENVLSKAGEYAAGVGKRVLMVANNSEWLQPVINQVQASLQKKGVEIAGIVRGAKENAPREDVYRIESCILHHVPDCLLAIGGGSTIDAVKAANVLATLGGFCSEIDPLFGTGLVTKMLAETGKTLLPLIAVQTAASSGAHLTKYSNVTDPVSGQKKLIVDEAIVPKYAVFDYGVTKSLPRNVTIDGAFDGIAHCLEVFYGTTEERFAEIKEIALTGIELIVKGLDILADSPDDPEARELIGYGTDLGGLTIMVGGTNGAHLTSFSLVDVTSHGRACAIMNPYYTVFFAPAIQKQLQAVADILKRYHYIDTGIDNLTGANLGIAVAQGLIKLAERVGLPTRLEDLPAFTPGHIEKALTAAKDPQLEMKLKNMPVPLNSSLVHEYMKPLLEAARTGDFSRIKIMEM